MDDNVLNPIELDFTNPQVQSLYVTVFDIATGYFGSIRQQRELTDHKVYVEKILGQEIGGYLVGKAISDAFELHQLPQSRLAL